MNKFNELIEIFPWNENFCLGIFQIDEQHKKLIDLLNALASGIVYKTTPHDLNHLFNELADYAVYHFQTEETIWQQTLPGDAWGTGHKQSHESFVSDLLRLKTDETNKPLQDVLEEVLSFLTHWLAFHILGSDKRMAKVVLAVQSGKSPKEAKRQAEQEMLGATEVLVNTVLAMYDMISNRTLQLMKEIVERQKAEQNAHALIQRNQLLMESTPEGIHVMDARGNIIEANDAFCRHLGYTQTEVLQLSIFDFQVGISPDQLQDSISEVLNGHAQFESLHRRKDGTLVDVEVIINGVELGDQRCLFALSRDISERKEAQELITNLAFYDALTQLPNRRMLDDRLEQAMVASKRTGCYGALMFLDLDNFKPLNDEFGHVVGDLLLIEAASRISRCVRETDTVARFGGDEFVVMLGMLDGDKTISMVQAGTVAEKIRISLEEPYLLTISQNGKTSKAVEHLCTSSIGIAFFLGNEVLAEDIIKSADIAMYQAKAAGRNSIKLYQAD